MPLPAMSGAEPWTGSNIDGNLRSGLMLADGAMPIVPHTRDRGRTGCRRTGSSRRRRRTSRDAGRNARSGCRCGTGRCGSPGSCAAIALKRSSQYGIVIEMPLDLVAEVTCFAGRVRASSKANRMMRSTPLRVKTVCWNTVSRSVPSNMRPPIDEYSPSVFSRTTTKSMSPDRRPASGVGMPGISRHGRRFDVLVEMAPELNQRAPERDVVGNGRRPADGAEEDRIVPADLGRSSPRASCGRAWRSSRSSSGNSSNSNAMPNLRRRGFERAQAFRNDFLADAVAGNDGDAMRCWP